MPIYLDLNKRKYRSTSIDYNPLFSWLFIVLFFPPLLFGLSFPWEVLYMSFS